MSGNNSLITYTTQTSDAIAIDSWLSWDQVPLDDDVAEIGEVADLLDSLYGIEPCVQSDVEVDIVKPSEATFNQVVIDQLDFAACAVGYDGSYEADIKIFRDDPLSLYKVVATNGEYVGLTRHEEIINISTLIDNADSIDLQMPILGDFSFSWGTITYDSGGICPAPAITYDGAVLNFGKTVTGKLYVTLRTMWDIVTVKIFGVEGEPVTGNVVAFYNHKAYELEIQHPLIDSFSTISCPSRGCPDGLANDDVECFEVQTHYNMCECTGKEDGNSKYTAGAEPTTCPQAIQDEYGFTQYLCSHDLGPFYFYIDVVDGYTDCPGDDLRNPEGVDPDSPEYFLGKCGEEVPEERELPRCLKIYDSWKGEDEDGNPVEITGGDQYWRDIYGQDVQFRRLMPTRGNCGQWIKEYILECVPLTVEEPYRWINPQGVHYISSLFYFGTDGVTPGDEQHCVFELPEDSGFYFDWDRTLKTTTASYSGKMVDGVFHPALRLQVFQDPYYFMEPENYGPVFYIDPFWYMDVPVTITMYNDCDEWKTFEVPQQIVNPYWAIPSE